MRGAKRSHPAAAPMGAREGESSSGSDDSTSAATAVVSSPALPGQLAATAPGAAGVATLLADRIAQRASDGELALFELRGGGAPPLQVGYGELLHRVRAAARALQRHGVGAGGMVGMGLGVGTQAIVHQLGAWWLGAGFVPLDVSLPSLRLRFLIEDAGASVVVASAADAPVLRDALPEAVAVALMVVEAAAAAAAAAASSELAIDMDHDDLAAPVDSSEGLCHIAYTSGSTGAPKGVACRHRNLLSYCLANAHTHSVGPSSRVLLAAAPSFDPSIGEAYTALLAGATLVLAPRAAVTSGLYTVLSTGEVTHVCTTPLLWSQLLQDAAPHLIDATTEEECRLPLPHLQVATLGGEKVPRQVVEAWAESVRLVNVYGAKNASFAPFYAKTLTVILPRQARDKHRETQQRGAFFAGTTEGTVYQTSHTFPATRSSNPACIGRPLPGTVVAVVRRSDSDAEAAASSASAAGERERRPAVLELASCDEVGKNGLFEPFI
jgi:acyl-CoA synthetase (AMP-forming)/AMP-acid ligase II